MSNAFLSAAEVGGPATDGLYDRIIRALAAARFLTFSVFVHVLALLLFGGIVLVRSVERELADFTASSATALAEEIPSDAGSEETITPPVLPDAAPIVSPRQVSPAPTAITANVDVSTGFELAMARSVVAGNGTGIEKFGDSDLGELLSKSAPGRMGGTAMTLFGTKAVAKDVVFVVDVSGSMISGAKSVETYKVIEKELSKVLRDLNDKNRFGIVVFSKDAQVYREKLMPVTADERSKAINWLKKKSPEVLRDPRADEEEKAFHHGTRADLGLAQAFAMQPDVIFFVSDGEPTGKNGSQILADLQALQSQRTTPAIINAIAYHADGGLGFMQALAQQNGGEFREVRDTKARSR